MASASRVGMTAVPPPATSDTPPGVPMRRLVATGVAVSPLADTAKSAPESLPGARWSITHATPLPSTWTPVGDTSGAPANSTWTRPPVRGSWNTAGTASGVLPVTCSVSQSGPMASPSASPMPSAESASALPPAVGRA
ncbi:MAG: hypothetical protein U1F43_24405 [Myxococcota bacterium]